jgi:hypothetical protein
MMTGFAWVVATYHIPASKQEVTFMVVLLHDVGFASSWRAKTLLGPYAVGFGLGGHKNTESNCSAKFLL